MTTYSQLKTDIADYTARSDIAAKTPLFVRTAESEINRVVRFLDQETDTTLTFSSPSYSASLPEGFLGFKHLFTVGVSNPYTVYCPPSQFHVLNNLPQDAFNAIRGEAGLIYTIESAKVKVQPPVGSTDPFDLDVTYMKRFLPLSDSNTTNYGLTNHYDLYLWGGLKEAWEWIDDEKMVTRYQARFNGVVKQIREEELARHHPAGPLVRRPPEVVT